MLRRPGTTIRRVVAALSVGVVLASVAGTVVLASSPDTLVFPDSSDLSIVFRGPADRPTALVAVQSPAPVSVLDFALVLRDGQTPLSGISVGVTAVHTSTGPVTWYSLSFSSTNGSVPAEAHGFLSARTPDGSLGPAVRPVTIINTQRILSFIGGQLILLSAPLPGGPGAVLGIGFVLAASLLLFKWLSAGRTLAGDIGAPKWSYDSWASTFTSVGALLGTVLGTSILPAGIGLLSGVELTGVSVLCGALVLAAPFLYHTLGHANHQGNGPVFVAAALLSFTGAFTELVALLIGLAGVADSVGSTVIALGLTVTCVALVALLWVYGWHALAVAFPPAPEAKPRIAADRDLSSRAMAAAAGPTSPTPQAGQWSLF